MNSIGSYIPRHNMVKIIIIINILGWITTEGARAFFNLSGQIPEINSVNSCWEQSYIGLVNDFTAADVIWSNLTLLFSIIGLWRMKPWG